MQSVHFDVSGNLPKHHLKMLIEMAYLKNPSSVKLPNFQSCIRSNKEQFRTALLQPEWICDSVTAWPFCATFIQLGTGSGTPLLPQGSMGLRHPHCTAPCWDRHRASIPSAIATMARAVPEHSPAGHEIHCPLVATDWISPLFLSWGSAAVSMGSNVHWARSRQTHPEPSVPSGLCAEHGYLLFATFSNETARCRNNQREMFLSSSLVPSAPRPPECELASEAVYSFMAICSFIFKRLWSSRKPHLISLFLPKLWLQNILYFSQIIAASALLGWGARESWAQKWRRGTLRIDAWTWRSSRSFPTLMTVSKEHHSHKGHQCSARGWWGAEGRMQRALYLREGWGTSSLGRGCDVNTNEDLLGKEASWEVPSASWSSQQRNCLLSAVRTGSQPHSLKNFALKSKKHQAVENFPNHK